MELSEAFEMSSGTKWLIVLAAGFLAAPMPAIAQDADAAALVATQVREQGFACADPATATRDPNADSDVVWTLTCADATYRVRLVPDQAAQIEPAG